MLPLLFTVTFVGMARSWSDVKIWTAISVVLKRERDREGGPFPLESQ
jgi:hypothetical protein